MWLVSRAVAPLKELWRWSKPLLKKKGLQKIRETDDDQVVPSGLICLKGGDLAAEIPKVARPRKMEIHEIFPLDYFREKYILYIPT